MKNKQKKNKTPTLKQVEVPTQITVYKKLCTQFVSVPQVSLFHLAVAISLSIKTYITDNPVLLEHKRDIKKDYKIQIVDSASAFSLQQKGKGVII